MKELVTNCDRFDSLKHSASQSFVFTKQRVAINHKLQLDIDRHNTQYPPINIKTFRLSHDRFLCIDNEVYHFGASIKDLGKKWFGFSKMEILTPNDLIKRTNQVSQITQ